MYFQIVSLIVNNSSSPFQHSNYYHLVEIPLKNTLRKLQQVITIRQLVPFTKLSLKFPNCNKGIRDEPLELFN